MHASVLDRVIATLGLDAPLHPWWLGEARPRLPARLAASLAAPCPSPDDLDPGQLLAAFRPEDRDAIERQVDDGHQHPVLSADEPDRTNDDDDVVHVQLGPPLIAGDRVLVRVCTRNRHSGGQTVTGDHHAWLTPDLTLPPVLDPPQRDLAAAWDRWVVGRSPGRRIDVNAATEAELFGLPGGDPATVRTILARRPFHDIDELRAVIGAAALRTIGRLIDWNLGA